LTLVAFVLVTFLTLVVPTVHADVAAQEATATTNGPAAS
jgi:hypothetical protein